MTYDVFISYSSKDQKIVEGICGYLEARGVRCFVAYRDIPRGVVWARAIVDALDQSRMMVVAFSDNFNRSEQVDREIELASEDHKPILTFRLNDVKFEGAKKYYLKNLNWIDAFPNPDEAFADLYSNICKLLAIKEVTNSNTNILESQLEFDPNRGEFRQKSDSYEEAKKYSKEGFIDGHEYVDLGLPSGIKWASCNIGAKSPEQYGDFFAWGETKPKTEYSHENSETYQVYEQWLLDNGFIDENGNLTKKYDAAAQNWGGSWHMPTRDEIKELLENTTSEWSELNGVIGRRLTSNINGKSIFLPASGWRNGTEVSYKDELGYYWSASIHPKNVHAAYDLLFSSRFIRDDWGMRSGGFNIRAVSE